MLMVSLSRTVHYVKAVSMLPAPNVWELISERDFQPFYSPCDFNDGYVTTNS